MSHLANATDRDTRREHVLPVRCMSCGTVHNGDQPITECPACSGLLDAVIDTDRTLTPQDFPRTSGTPAAVSGVWRFAPLLPEIPQDAIVTRWEGNTPLYADARLADYAGLAHGEIRIKHEGHNPTASFKDRGMTLAVSHARAIGSALVACASTGNTSASLASYAAAAGMPSMVIIPEGKISAGKLAQTIAFGARVVQVEGDFDVALRLLRELTADGSVYLANSVNPFRPEGQKTIVFELLDQLGWQVPDVIALPGGNLGNTAAFGKALAEAYQTGLIDRLPRIATIQAAGAAPFAAYYASGFDRYEAVQAETIATAIKIGDPASVERARRSIEQTSGWVVAVTDDEIMDAKARIDSIGIGCEPASAASLAGVRKLTGQGEIAQDASVVCVLTGNVLKDTDAITTYHLQEGATGPNPHANRPVSIPSTMDALKRVVDDAIHG
ncbi:MAG TPA: threonine synthase [Thermomicrobiales bacterium]|nr:threonine synthase [Thermomicrobiales bacterium]